MSLAEQLTQHFQSAPSTPFLFVGSGFSRRYIGLEDWEALLRRFCKDIKSFDYYFTTANGSLPQTAQLIAEDFHEHWWASPQYETSREKNKAKLKDKTSALRIEIANYITSLSLTDLMSSTHKDEIEILSRLNVDGIITTNWDLLLEQLFPDYKVFVGQSELLFSNPQSIAEIYKIHGSSSRPSSLVLTQQDYDEFDSKNPYLAAKLITLFVEHPIVFIGYSLTDPNIVSLLKAIVSVLGTDNISKLQNNLIFVGRADAGNDSYSQTYMAIEGGQIPITIVKAHSFVPVYQALETVKRKIPARVLRLCKEQIYELVKSKTPEAKLHVADIDKIDKKDDLQFVVGVGMNNVMEGGASEIGYQGVTLIDIFHDIVRDDKQFDPAKVLGTTIPNIGKSATYVPVYKYLKAIGIDSAEAYERSDVDVKKHMGEGTGSYSTASYLKTYLRSEKNKTMREVVETNTPEKAAIFLAFVPKERFDLGIARQFLEQNLNKLSNNNYSIYFRKLACLYDRFAYGWDGAAPVLQGKAKRVGISAGETRADA